MILAGIDEAGYGPTLGPLVVSVSLFRIQEGPPGAAPDLWKLLESAVSRKPDGQRVAVEDSKKLFNQKMGQKKGCRDLEEGILSFLYAKDGILPPDFRSLLRSVAQRGKKAGPTPEHGGDSYLDEYPWYRGQNVRLPVDSFFNVIRSRAQKLKEALCASGVEYLGLASRPVEVLEFNHELSLRDNKAGISFQAVGSFLQRIWKQFSAESVEVAVDRQGGRLRYGALLFQQLRPKNIHIEQESEELGVYRLTRRRSEAAGGPFRVSFAPESESRCLPVALASMASKYLREVHMLLFNKFWQERQANLKATAGYYVDACRFLTDIQPLKRRLGIDDALLVRRR